MTEATIVDKKEDISKAYFREKLSELLSNLPPNYFVIGFLEAREKFEGLENKAKENELEFILREMEKLPEEYGRDIRGEAERITRGYPKPSTRHDQDFLCLRPCNQELP